MEMGVHGALFPDEYIFENLKMIFIRRYVCYRDKFGLKSVSQFPSKIPDGQLPVHKIYFKEKNGKCEANRYILKGMFTQHNRHSNIVGFVASTNMTPQNYRNVDSLITLYIYDLSKKTFLLEYELPSQYNNDYPMAEFSPDWKGRKGFFFIDNYVAITLHRFQFEDENETEIRRDGLPSRHTKVLLELTPHLDSVTRTLGFKNVVSLSSFIITSYHKKIIYSTINKNIEEEQKEENYIFHIFDLPTWSETATRKLKKEDPEKRYKYSPISNEPFLDMEDNLIISYVNGRIYVFDLQMNLLGLVPYMENEMLQKEIRVIEEYKKTECGRIIWDLFFQNHAGVPKEQRAIHVNMWLFLGCVNGKVYFKVSSSIMGYFPYTWSLHFIVLGQVPHQDVEEAIDGEYTYDGEKVRTVHGPNRNCRRLHPENGTVLMKPPISRLMLNFFCPSEDLVIFDYSYSSNFEGENKFELCCVSPRDRMNLHPQKKIARAFVRTIDDIKIHRYFRNGQDQKGKRKDRRWEKLAQVVKMDLGRGKRGSLFPLSTTHHMPEMVTHPRDRFHFIRVTPFLKDKNNMVHNVFKYRELAWFSIKDGEMKKQRLFRIKKDTEDYVLIDKIVLISLEKK